MADNDGYAVSCAPLSDMDEVRTLWLELEERADNPFFLSWLWIGSWLETHQPDAQIMRVSYAGRIVALATFVFRPETRYKIINSLTLLLNQTGDLQKDQIWIEYNNFLTDRDHHEGAIKAGLKHLVDKLDWDEFVIGALNKSTAELISTTLKLERDDLWQAPCYGTDLSKLRSNNEDLMGSLSRNTRYQIRNSRRKYEARGELALEKASSVDEALAFFDEIGPLHKKRWGENLGESGFANPNFVNFHRNLIKESWDKGAIDLIRITNDNKAIAYFYNFIYSSRVYFYLSGLVFEQDHKFKPGMLGHALCIQDYMDKGLDFYDFMGGGERYKASLGEEHEYLYRIKLQKPLLKFKLENCAKKMKRVFDKNQTSPD